MEHLGFCKYPARLCVCGARLAEIELENMERNLAEVVAAEQAAVRCVHGITARNCPACFFANASPLE